MSIQYIYFYTFSEVEFENLKLLLEKNKIKYKYRIESSSSSVTGLKQFKLYINELQIREAEKILGVICDSYDPTKLGNEAIVRLNKPLHMVFDIIVKGLFFFLVFSTIIYYIIEYYKK